jgi:hypothetical protein
LLHPSSQGGSVPREPRSGRSILLIGSLLVTAAICWTVSAMGWPAAWEQLGVAWPGSYSFLDTRIITGAAESFAAGYDPLHENPRDPFQRPLNYPRVWHALAFLGVREAHSDVVGSIFVGLFLAGVGLAFSRLDVRAGLLLLLFLVSPAVLFGVERGNNDLVVFFLVALALGIGRRNPVAGIVPIVFAAVLKIYPIFALGYGLRERSRRSFVALGGAALLFVVYCALTADDLRAMRLVTERSYVLSYGVETTEMLLRERLGLEIGGLRWALTAAAGLALVASWAVGRRIARRPAVSEHVDAFRTGAGIFLGTFLLVSSWDYRMMFLFFTIPQLLAWIDAGDGPRDVRLASWLALILVFVLAWKSGNTPTAHLALAWSLFAALGYLYTRTLPAWREEAGAVSVSAR